MLPDTFTLGSLIYKKISADSQTGARYKEQDPGTGFPTIIDVKHTIIGSGANRAERHLVSVRTPVTTQVAEATWTYAGVDTVTNVTITKPYMHPLDTTSLIQAVSLLTGGTLAGISTFATSVLDGSF